MALNAGTIWEVRTTGNANNGGGFFNRLPGTSVDYSQQNASQLAITDLVGALASVVVTSVIGGFTAGMVGNLMQIRGGVNFTVGFYEIVQWNSGNSVNLDRVPVVGAGSGGLAEVGGALISPETFILQGVANNICYVKSGTYTFTATRTQVNTYIRLFGYDTSRDVAPTGNSRPLIQLGAFWIAIIAGLALENFRFTGSATQLILGGDVYPFVCFNCKFENTNNAGTRNCIYVSLAKEIKLIDCEFSGTPGATSYGFNAPGNSGNVNNGLNFGAYFCFFHDLTYGFNEPWFSFPYLGTIFFKCTFARMGITAINNPYGANPSSYPINVLFCSFYQSGSYHLNIENHVGNIVYGNTFEGATISAIRDNAVPDNDSWWINSNNFWNNGASVIGCKLDLNNIGLNPLFVNPAGNDFNFGPGSPCIDNALGIRLGV